MTTVAQNPSSLAFVPAILPPAARTVLYCLAQEWLNDRDKEAMAVSGSNSTVFPALHRPVQAAQHFLRPQEQRDSSDQPLLRTRKAFQDLNLCDRYVATMRESLVSKSGNCKGFFGQKISSQGVQHVPDPLGN